MSGDSKSVPGALAEAATMGFGRRIGPFPADVRMRQDPGRFAIRHHTVLSQVVGLKLRRAPMD